MRSGSRRIDHRQDGNRKDSEWSEKTRYGGFFVACAKRAISRTVMFFQRLGTALDNIRPRRAGRGS
jgi:hypothetical protein